jgi:serine/threonine protein kinase
LVEEDAEAYDDVEYDWCGRGMHVNFASGEKIPLEIYDSAGHGSTSSVDIVKCRRIKLARKLTHMTHRTDKRLLLKEVQALQKLRHAHVVQLIGTYRQGRKFAALLYPVADMDLAVYLEEARYMPDADGDWTGTTSGERAHQDVLSKGSLCLISALRYVHESGIKHMDIKPANILLKRFKPPDAQSNDIAYRLYLCDFGLAQANFAEESQTETYPGKTPMYASPEVAAYNLHGRASDVFSLGCVLLEMATVYSGLTVESLKLHIQTATTNSYHENLDHIRSWIGSLEDMKVTKNVLLGMLQERPEKRLSLVKADGLVCDLQCPHHHDPPEPFEADSEDLEGSVSEPEVVSLEAERNAETPPADASPGDMKPATMLVKTLRRAPSLRRTKSVRREISAPVELLSSTNMLTSNTPDLYPEGTSSSRFSTASESD